MSGAPASASALVGDLPAAWPRPLNQAATSQLPLVIRLRTHRRLGPTLPKYLRHLIRQHGLVPTHRRGERYTLSDEDQARTKSHPAVRSAVENRRRRMG
jgi:hypothetical protein